MWSPRKESSLVPEAGEVGERSWAWDTCHSWLDVGRPKPDGSCRLQGLCAREARPLMEGKGVGRNDGLVLQVLGDGDAKWREGQ